MTLILRADADPRIGLGHVLRCLALAQAWEGRSVFLARCESPSVRERIASEGFSIEPVGISHPGEGDLEALLELCRFEAARGRPPVAVVDGYHFDSSYQRGLSEAGVRFLCIDDYGHAGHYWADWLLNQNASADKSLYEGRAPRSRLLLGPGYALLRREFRTRIEQPREIPKRARKLLVTMGGSDPANATEKVLEALARLRDPGLEARVLAGPDNARRERLAELALSLRGPSGPDVRVLAGSGDMPSWMAWADLAVSAGGSTTWEMAAMGLPNVVLAIAENQSAIARQLGALGVSVDLGWHEDAAIDKIRESLEALISDAGARASMSKRGRSLVDGSGAARVCAVLREALS